MTHAQVPLPPATVDTVTVFTKAYSAKIRGNVSSVYMGHELNGILRMPRGWYFAGRLAMDESFYRLQDRRDESKNLSGNLSMPFGPRLLLTGALSHRGFFNRVVTFSGEAQDFKTDTQRADARLNYLNTFAGGLQVNGMGAVGVNRSEQTFLNDLFQEGALGGRVSYTLGNRVTVTGRGFIRTTSGTARASGVSHGGLGMSEDSLSTVINVKLSRKTDIDARYERYSMVNEFMDLPRGVFLEQQFNENLIRERETRGFEDLSIKLRTIPNEHLQMALTAQHSEKDSRFINAFKRNARTVTDGVRAALTYSLRKNRSLEIVLDSFEVLHDLGENSLGTFIDKRQSARIVLDYPVTGTLTTSLSLGTALFQNFYRDFDVNPRDRDQLNQFIKLGIRSAPFSKVTTSISLSASQTDFVNISGSLSANNRKEISFDFRPEFTYKINDRVELMQQYGMNIEFTDYVFSEDDNFLDRNFMFSNTIRARLTPRLSAMLRYTLLLHDRGSYLIPYAGAERLLDINQEDRRDAMKITFRYRITPRLTILGGHDYTVRRDVLAGPTRPAFRDGGIEVGAEGNYGWGVGRALRFRLVKVNRFGQFNSPAQEDFWVADSSLNFGF